MRYACILSLVALVLPALAAAGTLDIQVRDAAGRTVRDAVVTVHPAGQPPSKPRFAWPNRVTQQDIQFQPFVLIVPVGADVAFPNRDKVRHHVYSFSKARRFELKLYGREEARTVRFDKPGVVALGCNIHDGMSGFVHVVDTPFAAKTDGSGAVRLTGLPGGQARVTIWHPHARVKGNAMQLAVSLPPSGNTSRAVTLPIAAR